MAESATMTTQLLPPCSACHCSADDHVADKTPLFVVDDVNMEAKRTFVLGACSRCECNGYTIEVPNPRTCVKIEGIE